MPLLSELVNDINAEQDALMLKERMRQYALQYCEALRENYKRYRIAMHERSATNPPMGRKELSETHAEIDPMTFCYWSTR